MLDDIDVLVRLTSKVERRLALGVLAVDVGMSESLANVLLDALLYGLVQRADAARHDDDEDEDEDDGQEAEVGVVLMKPLSVEERDRCLDGSF